MKKKNFLLMNMWVQLIILLKQGKATESKNTSTLSQLLFAGD